MPANSPAPVLEPVPSPEEMTLAAAFSSLWIMKYATGSNVNHINFFFQGTRQEAVAFGKQFCAEARYRMIWVEPFIADLDYIIQRRNNGDEE